MAYSSVGTPRFYINDPHFMIANGAGNVEPMYGADGWDNGIAMLNIGKDYEIPALPDNLARIDFPVRLVPPKGCGIRAISEFL